MPRRARVVFPGIAHHVTQRGNNRQTVFFSPDDRRLYLDLLSHRARRDGTRVLGYCLMTNHVHLVVVPDDEGSLARTLGRVHSEYALALNRAAGSTGHVWQNRFFSCPLDELHLMTALRYTDLNPVRAGLAAQAWDWPWSSARVHSGEKERDSVLDCDWAEHFDGWDCGEWKKLLMARMDESDSGAVRGATRTGEPLGSGEFVAGLERQAGRRLRVFARGRPRGAVVVERDGLQGCLFDGERG